MLGASAKRVINQLANIGGLIEPITQHVLEHAWEIRA
jgi:hypothetical protein